MGGLVNNCQGYWINVRLKIGQAERLGRRESELHYRGALRCGMATIKVNAPPRRRRGARDADSSSRPTVIQ